MENIWRTLTRTSGRELFAHTPKERSEREAKGSSAENRYAHMIFLFSNCQRATKSELDREREKERERETQRDGERGISFQYENHLVELVTRPFYHFHRFSPRDPHSPYIPV